MLLALSEVERHGYALTREILRRTGGRFSLGAGDYSTRPVTVRMVRVCFLRSVATQAP